MLRLYEASSRTRLLSETLKNFFVSDRLEKLSRRNALRDFKAVRASGNKALVDLHRELERIRIEANTNYPGYDYGSGYYYQSMKAVEITGYRNTEERVSKLGLKDIVRGKSVLDIGANTGFVLLSVAEEVKKGVGVEINPYLVESADAVRAYLRADKVEFVCSSFEDYAGDGFDVVFSFANHSTFDGQTRHSLDEYFAKAARCLNDSGILIFESHAPGIEPQDKLQAVLTVIGRHFEFPDPFSIDMAGFLDKGRSYLVARKR